MTLRQAQGGACNLQPATPYCFCTYFDRNYLTRGLALYTSLRRHCCRPFTLWILCFDDETYAVLTRLNLPGIRLISQQEFEAGDQELVRAKANRSRVEYYWTCTPSLPLYVLQKNPEVDVITYLDADLYFFSDPTPIYDEFGDGSILIVEHRYAPEHAHHAATSGIYNVGWMAFRRDENGLGCLRWWRARCLEWCYLRIESGKFGDQKYLDDWPERFAGVVVVQHLGAGLAPWNLTRYQVKSGGGRVTVDGHPLIFYHFHGYRQTSRRLAKPADYLYRILPEHVKLLYLPYARALRDTQRQVGLPLEHAALTALPTGETTFAGQLLAQGLLLVEPAWLGLLLWRVGGSWRDSGWRRHVEDWRRENSAILEDGFRAYAAGDLDAARRQFLSLIWRNPLVLRNAGIAAVLLESMLGPARMGRYRKWRAQVRTSQRDDSLDRSAHN